MKRKQKLILGTINDWLETHWVTPAYSGWILIGIALSFFGAATNTMAGWLYVLSGMILALLGVNALMAVNNLKRLFLERSPIEPISAGERLTLELAIYNPTRESKTLLQVIDLLPPALSPPAIATIETISPQETVKLTYSAPTQRRGVYRWQELELKTAAPLGAFSCRRRREIAARAIVYPQVLPLKSCSLVDGTGREGFPQRNSDRRYRAAPEGITKALRQYRFGDPTRLIHWRSSARFGELQVRELETIPGRQEVIICLDNSPLWREDYFEEAVIAAASLYFYAGDRQLDVQLWTPEAGTVRGRRVVLETLAAIESGKGTPARDFPFAPLIWLAQDTTYFESLPNGSRWFLFPPTSGQFPVKISPHCSGTIYNPRESLQIQLEKPPAAATK